MDSLLAFLPDLEQLGFIGYWLVLVISLLESLVFTGMFIPGTIVVILMGSLAAHRYYLFWILVVFSAIGAAVGDSISYEIGRRHHMHLERWPSLKRHIDRARPFLQCHRRKSIVLGRFVGFVRPIVPFLAGVADVRRPVFYTIDILSALAWSMFYVGLGYVFGAAWKVAFVWSSRAILLLVFLLLCGSALLWLWKWALRSQGLVNILMFACVLSAVLFAGISEDYLSGEYLTLLDVRLANLLFELRSPLFVQMLRIATLLGEWTVVVPLAVLFSLFAPSPRCRSFSIALWISLLLSGLATVVSKTLFHRLRPDSLLAVMDVYGFSFPSTHATMATVLYGFLAYGVVRTQSSLVFRSSAVFVAFILIVVVDFSRLYLGVHYLTDVVAGNLMGLSILFLIASAREWQTSRIPLLRSSS